MRLLNGIKKLLHARSTAFGCDISDHSIRFAALGQEGDHLTLKSFGMHMLPEGVIVNGEVRDAMGLVQHLREASAALKGQRLHTPFVVASLPDPQCFLRIVQLPKISDEEIPKALMAEIEANIPLSLSDVYYEWESAPAAGDQDHLDVLVAVAPKVLVDQYVLAYDAAGLKPVAFEVDALSAARSTIPFQDHHERPLMLIDVAFHRATFLIFANGMVRFTASIPLKAVNATEAEIKELVKLLAAQVRPYMEFFSTHATHTHLPFTEIQQILISGDDFHGSSLATGLSVALGIPVQLANPWVNILKPPLQEVPMLPYKESLGYATVLGLALRAHHEFSD
ncbi:MAG: pilus assembly protein PilM [bacterium]|nr:pilus assembly protein PilM [bacterium]